MSAPFRVPPDPVGQQAPPARAATSNSKPLRGARGSLLLTTGTGCTPDDTSLSQDPCAWQRGYRAGYLGLSACLFPAGSVESWSWISGYIEGKAARVAKPKSILDVHCKH
jgi:ribosome modulation factor